MSRPSRKKLLLSAAILTVVAGGFILGQYGAHGPASAQEAGAQEQAMPVPVIDIAPKSLQLWKEFSGRLVAVDYVEIRPQVSGIIEKVNFEDGQIVKAGDILFNIDPRPYEAAVASARAELAAAQQEEQYAQKELKRAEELLKTGAISQAGYDQRINAQRTNKSAISAANARLKAAQVDLGHAAIKAPISGRISRPEITAGNLVAAANAPLLTTIVSDKEIYGDFEVDEKTYLTFVRAKAGQDIAAEQTVPVKLTLQNDKKEYSGVIKSFDNKINPTTGTIRARAVFGNADNALLPGMFANVRIGSPSEEQLITVPEKAVLTDQSRKFVYVVADGAATYREVKLGDVVGSDRIVLSGLNPGDKVIIDNLMKLRPGAKVHAMSPQELEGMKQQMAQQQGGNSSPMQEPSETASTGASPEQKEIPFEEPEGEQKATAAPEQAPAQE